MGRIERKAVTYAIGDRTTTVLITSRDEIASGLSGAGDVLWVADEHTCTLVSSPDGRRVVLGAGETAKTWDSVEMILSRALASGLGRDALFVGVGGGVIGDLCGFAASIYMRGCDLVLVPTTLLAMVDASLGGKTGMDFGGLKNIVGTFHPAREVRIAPELLMSLPVRDYHSGLAELIKHALLVQTDLLETVEACKDEIMSRDIDLLADLLPPAIDVKGKIVEDDFREKGRRAFLNLGHTFGHAYESASGFDVVTHGEAVAWGIDKAMKLGVSLGVTEREYADRVTTLLGDFGFDLTTRHARAEKICAAMKSDKKKRGGTVRFVLQRSWGDTFLTEADEDTVERVIEATYP